ncbi:acyl-CoA desaturase [Salinisphaera sp. USBA-960]|uniref:fatty acid desaturase n=1 Tax=Salinisphaera orenii TaxID=856731 RepID=UPI000DBE9658|nr:acyl-CoA desaturase [Salifodinibacter halophilus]NNC27241.1 acyl-CoA desaturase [Salifodinibacter halophilus]
MNDEREYPENPELDDSFKWLDFMPFVLLHVGLIAIWWTGFTLTSILLCVGLYVTRVFGITGGYHRYFSHRGYKTGRVFQFVIAFMGASAFQKGPLWWAAKHREHHRESDMPADAHSPRHYGLANAHVGWVYRKARNHADLDLVKDFSKYPEIRWLDRHQYLPGLLLAVACVAIDGWAGLVVGFMLSTALVYHATFTINSLDHMIGRQRYLTGDDSRNNWLLALFTMGEGWHNNHHYYPAAARNGFFWWEIDLTYYLLVGLSKLGIVWDLRQPPQTILANEKAPTQKVIDKCAVYIADGFSVEHISATVRQRWEGSHVLDDLRYKAVHKWSDAEAYIAEMELPGLPNFEQLRNRAHSKFKLRHSGLEHAIERARELLHEAVAYRLLERLRAEPV